MLLNDNLINVLDSVYNYKDTLKQRVTWTSKAFISKKNMSTFTNVTICKKINKIIILINETIL